MTQAQLKNIYEALGDLAFRYHGQLLKVVYCDQDKTYKLEPIIK